MLYRVMPTLRELLLKPIRRIEIERSLLRGELCARRVREHAGGSRSNAKDDIVAELTRIEDGRLSGRSYATRALSAHAAIPGISRGDRF